MKRLWLTDDQAKTLCRALRAHISTLHKCAYDVRVDGEHDLEEKYVNEANALDEILDIIDTED